MSEQDKKLQQETGDVAATEAAKQTTDADNYKAKHDALYGKYTARAEKEAELARKLFKANPKELETLEDGIKNKIVKEEYGFDTFSEAKAILGENFYMPGQEQDEEDEVLTRLAILEKEKKMAEYKSKQFEVDSNISIYLAKNPNLSEVEGIEEKIKVELNKLNPSIDINERLQDAVALVKVKFGNPEKTYATATAGTSNKATVSNNEEVRGNSEFARALGNR